MSDLHKMAKFGEEGVDLLISDSTNALNEGMSISETKVDNALNDIFDKYTNRRMIKQSPMIDMGYGISEWGAMPDRLYFIVTWDLFGDLRSHFIKSPYRKVIIEDMYPNSYDSSKSLSANAINFLNKIRRDKRENELRIELIEKKQK